MKNFGYFIERGDVRKQHKDPALSKSLSKRARERLLFAKRQRIDARTSTFILEELYEAIREMTDAKLVMDGYKSYSHEASISYLKRFREITEAEINRIDYLRRLRNSSKYYGGHIPPEKAIMAMKFAAIIMPKLESLLK